MVFLFDTLLQRVELGMTVKNNKEHLIIPPKLNKTFPQTNVFLYNISVPQILRFNY